MVATISGRLFCANRLIFLKGKDAMNKFVEITSRIGLMYSEFLRNGNNSMEVLAEIDRLEVELRRSGCVNASFFDAMLRQGFMFDLLNANKQRAEGDSFVYVLYAEDSGLTKIGFSTRVNKRVNEISRMSGATLKMIAKIPGTRELEVELHHKYGGFRAHGEWFMLRPEHLSELSSFAGNQIIG